MPVSPRRPRVSLDLLRGFEAAARHLGFTAAAQELCVTQSAVSRQIKSLEEQIGAKLFARAPRGVRLTPAGQELLAAVSRAHELVDDAVDLLGADSAGRELRVAAAVPLASRVIAPHLHEFLARAAAQDVRLLSTNEPVELERGGAHVVVRHWRDGAAPTGATLLARDAVSPVCSAALLARPGLASPADLARHCLLRHEAVVEGRTRIDWVRWLQAQGLGRLRPARLVTFGQYDQVIDAARAGTGVALGRRPLLTELLAGGELVEPFPSLALATGGWYAVLAPGAAAQPGAREFVGWLRGRFAERPRRRAARYA